MRRSLVAIMTRKFAWMLLTCANIDALGQFLKIVGLVRVGAYSAAAGNTKRGGEILPHRRGCVVREQVVAGD